MTPGRKEEGGKEEGREGGRKGSAKLTCTYTQDEERPGRVPATGGGVCVPFPGEDEGREGGREGREGGRGDAREGGKEGGRGQACSHNVIH